jgi:signal peptidase I
VKDTTCTALFRVKASTSPSKEGGVEIPVKSEWGPLYFLAWTTTPWTLAANSALCVGPKIDYVTVETFNPYSGQPITVILAEARVSAYFNEKGKNGDFGAFKQGDKIIVVPPKKVLDKLRESEIPDAIDLDMQQTLLKAHEEVELDGKCPKNIEAYIILMNVYNQVKDKKMDYVVINDQLNKQRNGGSRVQSCAFSREWNKRYQESASFECDIDHDRCLYRQENDGNSEWSINYEQDRFEYINKKFLFFNLNPKSIHKGGSMLDLRLIRLSTKLYLEAYINLKGEPVTLGLIIVPGDKTIEDYDDGEEDDGTMVED